LTHLLGLDMERTNPIIPAPTRPTPRRKIPRVKIDQVRISVSNIVLPHC